jgi:Spy/CpxP family protein refolding chaperone
MFRRHVTKFLLASSCALGLAPLAANEALAQGMGEGMGMGMRGGMHHRGGDPMMMQGLTLTEQQRDQIFKIHHDAAPAMREQMKQVTKARTELRQVAMADKFDEAKARQAADAQAKALSNMAVMRAQTMSRVRQVLTAEQRQKMDEMRNRRGGMESHGRG